jgi:hypothetical protein
MPRLIEIPEEWFFPQAYSRRAINPEHVVSVTNRCGRLVLEKNLTEARKLIDRHKLCSIKFLDGTSVTLRMSMDNVLDWLENA